MTARLEAMGNASYAGLTKPGTGRKLKVFTGEFREVPSMLDAPLGWKKPRRIFVNSMSDLFGEGVSDAFIDRVLAVMLLGYWHTYQILTKRADRMERYLSNPGLYDRVLRAADEIRKRRPELYGVGISNPSTFPPRWIHWGVSVESRDYLSRIEHLRRTPAKVRFLSIEPLLEDLGELDLEGIHWVIVGGESGRNARTMHPDWVRSIRDQCVAAGVPFFFKQWGVYATVGLSDRQAIAICRRCSLRGAVLRDVWERHAQHCDGPARVMYRVGKKAAGRALDGRTWDEMPRRVG